MHELRDLGRASLGSAGAKTSYLEHLECSHQPHIHLIFSRVRFSVSGDGTLTELSGRGIMSAKAGSGISVMRSDLDASTSTEVDAHEAQWRAGVNRQARPDAASQRRAASLAAAAKRRRIRT